MRENLAYSDIIKTNSRIVRLNRFKVLKYKSNQKFSLNSFLVLREYRVNLCYFVHLD